MNIIKYTTRTILVTALIAGSSVVGAAGQKCKVIENQAVVRDVEMVRIPRYQFEYGEWERYRRGDFDNLRLTDIDGQRFLLSRTYVEEHRHVTGSYGIMPIFVFHYHPRYNGALLDAVQVATLRDIEPGDTIRVESRTILTDFEAEEFDELLGALLLQRPARQSGFFLWVCRTKKGRKDVVRIVDTGDIEGYKVLYWEIPYKTYRELFE